MIGRNFNQRKKKAMSTWKDSPPMDLQTFEYSDLIGLDKSISLHLATALTTTGAVQIVNIPGYVAAKEMALKNVGNCLVRENIHESVLDDSSRRRSLAGVTVGGVPAPIDSPCAADATGLRSLVDAVGRQVFYALDVTKMYVKDTTGPVMEPYQSFGSLISSGDHLEHLHVYYPPPNDSEAHAAKRDVTLPFHADSGLMIAMTPGYYGESTVPVAEDAGLYIELPTGIRARATFRDDAVIIMVGQGGQYWLNPVLGQRLRAVPHAMVVVRLRSS